MGIKEINALRLLANCYKHDSSKSPDKKLLTALNLEIGANCAALPESDAVQAGLAVLIGLGNGADYCEIPERFVVIVDRFLEDVRGKTSISRVNWPGASLLPENFAR